MTPRKKRPVVVTTEHRGVFFGLLDKDSEPDAKTVTISEAQMCVYWSADIGGVAVMEATEAAVGAWRGRPWSK